jgi:CarD family transcriptional regulator
MRGFVFWGIIYSVCGFIAWLLLGAIFLTTLYLAYLSSFPAVLFAIFLAPVAVLYWVWQLSSETGRFFNFFTLMCLGWIALNAIKLFAQTMMANWKPKESTFEEPPHSKFEEPTPSEEPKHLTIERPLTATLHAQRDGFSSGEFIVYPAHGVGQIIAIEEQEISGAKLELFVINFLKDRMTLRVPTAKVARVGMRKLSDESEIMQAQHTLTQRPHVAEGVWARVAQEYDAKINSGDIVAIAEVVRDLYRSNSQPEQAYSERQLYEAALDRLSREIAVVHHVPEEEVIRRIEGVLSGTTP